MRSSFCRFLNSTSWNSKYDSSRSSSSKGLFFFLKEKKKNAQSERELNDLSAVLTETAEISKLEGPHGKRMGVLDYKLFFTHATICVGSRNK